MLHRREKMLLIEVATLALAIILSLIAFAKGVTILIFITLFLFIFSLLSNALLHLYMFRHSEAYKQIARACVLFILTIWIVFRL